MSGISSIGSVNNNIYGQISSGKMINSAADDAAGLAISEKMEKEINGLNKGGENSSDAVAALNIADGALSNITDSLQRVYELGVKASNTFMYGEEERAYMQDEISNILQGIDEMSSRTTYNEKNLLDGSTGGMHIASNPDGSGMEINMPDSTVKALGLEGFDVTKDFDLSKVSDALKKVTGDRVSLGAQSVSLEYAKNYNAVAAENTLSSKSRIEDLDIGKAVGEKQKKELLQNYALMMQRKKQEEEEKKARGLFQF